MVTNFEEITQELTAEEQKLIKPLILGFKNRGKENPIKSDEVVVAMNKLIEQYSLKIKMTGARLRKCCNYIRTNGLIPLIATSDGYYVSYEKEEIEKQIRSLYERAASIQKCADGLKKFTK